MSIFSSFYLGMILLDAAPAPVAVLKDTSKEGDVASRGKFLKYEARRIHGKEIITPVMENEWIKDIATDARPTNPTAWLTENLRVETDVQNGEIRISFGAGDVIEQTLIIRAIVRTYIKKQVPDRISKQELLQSKIRAQEAEEQLLASLLETAVNRRNASIERQILLLRGDIVRGQEKIAKLSSELAIPDRIVVVRLPGKK